MTKSADLSKYLPFHLQKGFFAISEAVMPLPQASAYLEHLQFWFKRIQERRTFLSV